MRKALEYLVIGLVAAGVITSATLPDRQTVPALKASGNVLSGAFRSSQGR